MSAESRYRAHDILDNLPALLVAIDAIFDRRTTNYWRILNQDEDATTCFLHLQTQVAAMHQRLVAVTESSQER